MQDRFPRVRKIPIRFEIFPPPGRILRNFTRDTDTFVACQLFSREINFDFEESWKLDNSSGWGYSVK